MIRKQTPQELLKASLPLIYLIIALFALRWTIVEPYVVPTGSMEPTLKTGDRLYALKCAYDVRFPFTDWILFRTGDLKRGDVILFRNPAEPAITYVKRAVGLPGDKIVYRDTKLFINGEEITRSPLPNTTVMYDIPPDPEDNLSKSLYIETLGGVRHYLILKNMSPELRYRHEHMERQDPMTGQVEKVMKYMEVTVPPDHFFYLGDNRDNSLDSRFGWFAPMHYLKGRAMFIWFSSWDWRVRPERIGTKIQ